jgi:hypothetical protein
MILAVLLLLTGLTISAVAIYYSVAGLTAIFSAAAVPIIVMGSALEIGKLVCASWLKANWERAPRFMRVYMTLAVVVLMLITSMGIFGFLSKAHNDQNLVSGDVQSKLVIYDEKIKTAKENIESDRKQLKQMDEAVDQVMGRSSDEKGADKANNIRRTQQKDRAALARDIESNQRTISKLNDEAAPIRAENRKVEAEVGPIKYIAAFIYGANPDSSLLEKAVTWIIILIVVVFDPLAVIMLLASQMTFTWAREERNKPKHEEDVLSVQIHDEIKEESAYEADDGPLTEEQISEIQSTAKNFLPTDDIGHSEHLFDEIQKDIGNCPKCSTELQNAPGIGPFCPNKECDVLDGVLLYANDAQEKLAVVLPKEQDEEDFININEEYQQDVVESTTHSTPDEVWVDQIREMKERQVQEQINEEYVEEEEPFDVPISNIEDLDDDYAPLIVDFEDEDMPQPSLIDSEELVPQFSIVTTPANVVEFNDIEPYGDEIQQQAMKVWKINNPQETYKKYINLYENGDIEYLPWDHITHLEQLNLSDRELIELQTKLTADNESTPGEVKGFGINFPSNAGKGDMFLRVDSWPSQLYKFNGTQWIRVSKNLSDSYVYDDAYIEHLIEKIDAGEYDPELLSDAERDRIAYQLTKITNAE